MSNHRFTIKEMEEFSELEILYQIVSDRLSTTTNIYSPLNKRLKNLLQTIQNLMDNGRKEI